MSALPWPVIPVGSMCDILDSSRKPITKRDRSPGPYPYYGATGVVDYVDGYLFDERLILIGEDGAKWGPGEYSAFIVDGKYWVNNHAHVIRPHRGKVLDEWIVYFLNYSDLAPFITGLTVPKLNQGKLREIPVPLPPLPEQRRIVAILDEAFAGINAAIANTEKNLANARELFESYLNRVFSEKGEGWDEKKLEDVCANLDSRRIPITKSKRESGDVPYYGASGIVDHVADYIFDEDLLLVSEDGANLLARTYPIAFSISGKSWVNNHAHVLRFDNLTRQHFVEYYLNSISLASWISGMAQPKLNQKALNSIPIPQPPEDEQKRIVEAFDALKERTRAIESLNARKLTALSELKHSILQKAFAGELTADMAGNKKVEAA